MRLTDRFPARYLFPEYQWLSGHGWNSNKTSGAQSHQQHLSKYNRRSAYCGTRSPLLLAFFFLLICSASAQASDTVDFSLPDIDGKAQKLSDYRGKWVVVNYWATWCPPCISEIPELVDFHETHKNKDAVVIGVDFEKIDTAELREFVDSYFMSYPILRMDPAPKSHLGVISGLPTSFLVSPEGVVAAMQTGPVTSELIEEFINDYNKQRKTPETKVESGSGSAVSSVADDRNDKRKVKIKSPSALELQANRHQNLN